MQKIVKVLYVNGGIMNRGGIESFMMNYYRNYDLNRIQIDFIVHGYEKGAYDDEIEVLGGKIYRVPIKSKHPLQYKKALKRIFLTGEYNIIHTHADAISCWILKIAKQCNIPVRIAHSHNTQHLTSNKIKLFINEIARKNINKYANYRFACSEAAGKWLFGEQEFTNIHNAIDLSKYAFDPKKREEIRKQLGVLPDEILIGHVGRFDTQKNHSFLIKVFGKVLEKNPKAKLMLIGDGWMKEQIEKQVTELNLKENIIFLGACANVYDYYNAMDLFVLPSLFEGLPVVLIEAQANGLQCVASTCITKSVSMGEQIDFVELDNFESWVEVLFNKNRERKDLMKELIQGGYSISTEAKKLQDKYIQLNGD
jgi:glycosyltransferase involved in cell wall biosynthesis